MNLEQALKKIAKLEKVISKKNIELEKKDAIIFEQQKKLNELLGKNEVIREKLIIERTKPFLAKNEKLDNIVINETEEVIKESKQKSGRKPGGKNFSNIDLAASVSEVIYEDPDISVCDNCDNDLVLASQKERYVVEVIPSTIKVIKIIKRSYKCPKCSKQDNKLYYPLSTSVFPGSILTPSFAVYIAYCKYELGIPFHHLERHLSNYLKADISKQLLSSWIMNMAELLTPLFDKMKDDLKHNSAKVIHSDETTLVISKQPLENKDRKKSYVYVYTTSYYSNQIQIYDFHESRAIDKTADWLSGYEGCVVCDDYAGYSKLAKNNENIKLQRCWAHARRRFSDILKIIPKQEQQKTLSYQILELINRLFYFEAEYKKNKTIPSHIIVLRNKDQLPILERIKELVFNTQAKPDSALEGALNYVRKIWDELLTYLNNGYIEISNNIAERAVKPFVINRKVFMTSGSYAGARYTTIMFSIIRSALINNLDIQKYLIYVLENINKKRIDELVPYSKLLPKNLISR